MYKKINLNNGIRVILNPMPAMESAAIGVWVAAGSRNETKRISGASHFLEHMIFKGTPAMTSRRIKEEIEGRGGSLNGFTSEEMTCYLAKVSARHIDIALSVLSEMVLHAHLSQREVERERTVIVQEIKMYHDLPNHHVHDILNALMWPRHPLGFPVAGDIRSVRSITRRDLLDYKKANYIPKNIALVLCGNLDQDKVMQRINRIFRFNVKKKPAPCASFKNAQSCPQMKILHKDTKQSHLSMGLHAFGRMHEDRYKLTLLHIILGANMSSRLFENIREKRGLAYEIGTEIKRYKGTGAFIVNAGTEHSKARKVISLILKELKKARESSIPEKEIKRAKEYFRVQFSLALENTMDHMLWLGERVVASGRLPEKDRIIKEISSVSAQDLQRVAKDVFRAKNLNLAMIGPVRDREKRELEKELGEL